MTKYYLSVLYKDKRGAITEEIKNICEKSSNFYCEKDTNRIYYDISLDELLKEKKNDLRYLALFTMKFNNSSHLKEYLITYNLLPESLKNKRMNIYTTYKNERFGLETGIPYSRSKQYLDQAIIKKYYLNIFDMNKDAYFQSKEAMERDPIPVDYTLFSRLYRILENRYSRHNYRAINKSLENVYDLSKFMKYKKGYIGHKVKSVREDLIDVLNRELYIKSDKNNGINYHGLIVLANSIAIHKKWLQEDKAKTYLELAKDIPLPTDEDYYKSGLYIEEKKPVKKLTMENQQLSLFDE